LITTRYSDDDGASQLAATVMTLTPPAAAVRAARSCVASIATTRLAPV
jgi:hypothetical protein